MEAYLAALGQNDLINQEWEIYKSTHYKYDPTYNYFSDALALGLKENKYLPDKLDEQDYIALFNERMFHTRLHNPTCKCGYPIFCDKWVTPDMEYIKHKIYMEYLSFKYKQFKRDWKPKDNEGLGYMFITLNYAPSYPIREVVLDTTRIVNLSILKQSKIMYCYEYNTGQGAHPHVHMLVELQRTGTVALSSFMDDVYKKQGLKENLKIDYKFSWAKDYKKRCRNRAICQAYILGNKIEEKVENVENDRLWRTNNNLEEYYIKDNK